VQPTKNFEWYDPSAITTKNGSLTITFSNNAEHGLDYTGGKFLSLGVIASYAGPRHDAVLVRSYTLARGVRGRDLRVGTNFASLVDTSRRV
jgi:hypothetical protein